MASDDRVDLLEQAMRDSVDRYLDLDRKLKETQRELRWVRQRLASFYPERHYCPKCKAPVHEAARSCGACGGSWGEVADPKAGLPR